MYIHSSIENGFRDPELNFSNNALAANALPYRRYANHKVGNHLYLLRKFRAEASVSAWLADNYHYQLHDVFHWQYVD